MVKILYPCALILALVACGGPSGPTSAQTNPGADAVTPAKQFFGAQKVGSSSPAESFGGYARGCVAGAVQLPETGPTWQAMRLSRNRNWAQPTTVQYVKDLSARVAQLSNWEGLYIGDMSQPRGGPMLSGHRSHQTGLDIDVWMLPPTRLNLSRSERENISSISMRRAAGAYTNNSWTDQHRQVLKMAASDPRVARIFVFAGAKVDMCKNETGDRSYLRKIRPWHGHHYHFHVRLKCPPGQAGCSDQAPPPAGDGCDWAEEWVETKILNPPPPDPNAKPRPPRQPLTLARLPQQCAALVGQ